MNNLNPLNSHILVSREERVSGNLILSILEGSPTRGKIVAVESNDLVNVGETVLFEKHSAEQVSKKSDQDMFFVKKEDLLAKIVDSKIQPLNGYLLLTFEVQGNNSIIVPEIKRQSLAKLISLPSDLKKELSGKIKEGDYLYFPKWCGKDLDQEKIVVDGQETNKCVFVKQDDIMAVSSKNFEPLNGNILVKYEEEESVIIIPDSAKSNQSMAKVVLISSELDDSLAGKISSGDVLCFKKYSDVSLKGTGKKIFIDGTEVEFEKMALVNQEKVLAKVKT